MRTLEVHVQRRPDVSKLGGAVRVALPALAPTAAREVGAAEGAAGGAVARWVGPNRAASLASGCGWVIFVDPVLAFLLRDRCVTQTQLNELLLPRRFDIEYRYSYTLTYVLCAFVYCACLSRG